MIIYPNIIINSGVKNTRDSKVTLKNNQVIMRNYTNNNNKNKKTNENNSNEENNNQIQTILKKYNNNNNNNNNKNNNINSNSGNSNKSIHESTPNDIPANIPSVKNLGKQYDSKAAGHLNNQKILTAGSISSSNLPNQNNNGSPLSLSSSSIQDIPETVNGLTSSIVAKFSKGENFNNSSIAHNNSNTLNQSTSSNSTPVQSPRNSTEVNENNDNEINNNNNDNNNIDNNNNNNEKELEKVTSNKKSSFISFSSDSTFTNIDSDTKQNENLEKSSEIIESTTQPNKESDDNNNVTANGFPTQTSFITDKSKRLSTPPSSITAFTTSRNFQSHRVAGDWKDRKFFTQGSTNNLNTSARKNLIGAREAINSSNSSVTTNNSNMTKSNNSICTDEVGSTLNNEEFGNANNDGGASSSACNSNRSSINLSPNINFINESSPISMTPRSTTPSNQALLSSSPFSLSASPTNSTTNLPTLPTDFNITENNRSSNKPLVDGVFSLNEEDDVKFLVKAFNSRKLNPHNIDRKSKISKQDAEWITKKFYDSDRTSKFILSESRNTIKPTTAAINKDSALVTNKNVKEGEENKISEKVKINENKVLENNNIKDSLKSSQVLVNNNNSNNSNNNILTGSQEFLQNEDPHSAPSYRFLEEVGKKKCISAEPSRRPGIKTPLFLNVPTLANPTQFHQIPPERLSSNLFSISVEENSHQDNPLLYNQQIINRVANDKDLSYLFFPVLKTSTNISSLNSISHSQPLISNNHNKNPTKKNKINKNPTNNNNIIGSNNSPPSNTIKISPTSPSISNASSPSDFTLSPSPSPCTSLSPSPSSPPLIDSPFINKESSIPQVPTNNTATTTTTTKDRKSLWNSMKSSSKPPLSPPATQESPPSSSPPINIPNNNSNNNNNNENNIDNSAITENNIVVTTISKSTRDLETIVAEEFKNREDILFCAQHLKMNRIKVRHATLDSMIDLLTNHRLSQPDLVESFLLTYKTFTTSVLVLTKLIERYECENQPNITTPIIASTNEEEEALEEKPIMNSNKTIKLGVLNIIKCWVDRHHYDFENNQALLDAIIAFLEGPVVDDGMEKVSSIILKTIDRKIAEAEIKRLGISTYNANVNSIYCKFPPSILPSLSKPDQVPTLQNFDDLEIARQLTLIEHEAYSFIKPSECINLAFSKADKETKAPNIIAIIKRSNLLPLWVATEIVQEERLAKRANLIKKFISIADQCKNLNNFNAVMEILSGLNLTPVFRLKKTWETIPRKYLATFRHLNSLMAPKFNFKVYRDVLHTKNLPCLPFLGVYLTDLTFLEEGSFDQSESGLINMVKRSQISNIVQEIQQYQQLSYCFTPVPVIRDFLLNIGGLQERALYKQSKIIEP
ncbi:hypothetical protein DICPUDRAFT_157929 [Dictyostelium purpureum]|uniref:Ras guanine nucleotide exchange factor n=1 Tax=Dictyostelium purpureum TaxID=5786 RepID=F1A0D7_DICPU|nr:uncharacterized protein DICPUDRAFT_157929 [Dictyostelium purpureum]EGC30334.1 hypothetical protein DICPUDRAFT_157929 [Dictyostelium purpureum]|eukprot:XP_003293131.1 hypothetical protein DICPUDRAFT_157929 [Dictyostelium purpureum]